MTRQAPRSGELPPTRIDRFLSVYRSAPLEIRKKARILLVVNLLVIVGLLTSGVGINLILDVQIRTAVVELAMAAFLVGTLLALRSGRYVLASSATIGVLLVGLTATGLGGYSGDQAVDYALLVFNLMPVILYACLIGSHQLIPVGAAAICTLVNVLFFVLAGLASDWELRAVEIGTLINGLIVIPVCGVMGYHVLRMNQELVHRTEKEAHNLLQRTEQLQEARERLRVTLRSIGDGVITTDVQGRVTLLNRRAEKLTGWSTDRGAGRSLSEVFDARDAQSGEPLEDPVARVLLAGKPISLDQRFVLRAEDGSEKLVADSGAPILDHTGRAIGVVLVFRDETEKARLQESLANAERLESLGVLAGGIAHDFNNLLNGVFGFVELARLKVDSPQVARDHLDSALGVYDRATALTQQLLTFARGGAPQTRSIDLGPLLREVVRFSLSGSSVTTDFQIALELWPSNADRYQIAQVVENLAINARQAMGEGGRFTVRASNLNIEQSAALPLAAGRYVHVEFSDDGPGIPEALRSRIFDPFFTTKQSGSGLGLATAFSIVARHRGHLSVEARSGGGTTFHVYLPAADQDVEVLDESTNDGTGHREHVLVVDDEPANLVLAREMLEDLGYLVSCADGEPDALDAATAARENGRPFEVALIDLTLRGGRGGQYLLQQLLEHEPALRGIATSGYTTDALLANTDESEFVAALRKPYLHKDLAHAMTKALSSAPSGPSDRSSDSP